MRSTAGYRFNPYTAPHDTKMLKMSATAVAASCWTYPPTPPPRELVCSLDDVGVVTACPVESFARTLPQADANRALGSPQPRFIQACFTSHSAAHPNLPAIRMCRAERPFPPRKAKVASQQKPHWDISSRPTDHRLLLRSIRIENRIDRARLAYRLLPTSVFSFPLALSPFIRRALKL
jgi:hypothetical protein